MEDNTIDQNLLLRFIDLGYKHKTVGWNKGFFYKGQWYSTKLPALEEVLDQFIQFGKAKPLNAQDLIQQVKYLHNKDCAVNKSEYCDCVVSEDHGE